MEHVEVLAKSYAPWLAIVIAAISLLWQMYSSRARAWTKLVERMNAMDKRLAEVETKMEIFWEATKESVKRLIKQPIHERKDYLIDRFADSEHCMSDDEIKELKEILLSEQSELLENKDAKAIAYGLLLYRINTELHRRESE